MLYNIELEGLYVHTHTHTHKHTYISQKEKGVTDDEMVGWHHRLNGHDFAQTLGGGGEPGVLVHGVTKSWT